jgi:hypothetical protein
MRFLFFLLVFTFSDIFIFGLPLYLFLFPFLNKSFVSFFKEYSTNKSIRKIVNMVVVYSTILLIIDSIHGFFLTSLNQVFLLNLFVVFIGVELYVYSKNDTKRKGIYMLLIIFLINALVAILQSLEISPFWELPELVNTYIGNDTSDLKYSGMKFEDFGRVRGLFLFIHKFSPSIMASCVLFFWHGFHTKTHKILFLIVGFITLYSSLLTQTRSIFVGLIFGFIIVIFLYYKRKFLKISIYSLLIILSIQFIITDENNFLNRFNQTNTITASNNDNYRLAGIAISLNNFIENPIIGSYRYSQTGLNKITVHGVLFRILGNYGLVGLFAYLILLIQLFKILLKNISKRFKVLFILLGSIFFIDAITHSSGLFFYDIFQLVFLIFLFGYSKHKNYA